MLNKNEGNIAVLLASAIGVITFISIASSTSFFGFKNRSLIRILNEKEGFYLSEIGAHHAQTQAEAEERPAITHWKDWGIRRYRLRSLTTRSREWEYCGHSKFESEESEPTVCLRKEDRSPTQQNCRPSAANQLVSFEKYPDGAESRELDEIHTQYKASHGISFCMWRMDNSSPEASRKADSCLSDENGAVLKPYLIQVGAPKEAFTGYEGTDDTPEPGMHTGNFFLGRRLGGKIDSYAGILISYENPVAEASGVILNLTTDPGNGIYVITTIGADGLINSSAQPSNFTRAATEDFGGTIIHLSGMALGRYPAVKAKPGSVIPWGFKHARPDIHKILIRSLGNEAVAVDNITGSKCATE